MPHYNFRDNNTEKEKCILKHEFVLIYNNSDFIKAAISLIQNHHYELIHLKTSYWLYKIA